MATKFKRGEVWYVKYKDQSAKWKNITCGRNASATEAETIRKKYDALELNYRHKAPVRKVESGLREQLELFRDNEIPRSNTGRPKGKKSIQRYKAIVNNFIRWLDDNNYAKYSDITSTIIKPFFDGLVDLKRSSSTISKHRQILINFFDWSINQNFCIDNPATSIKNPKRDKKVPRFFSDEELKKIFAAANDQYRNIFKFLYLTGLRIGELGNLEWTDYLEHQKTITLRVIEGNKTKREEVVPLNNDAVKIVEDQKKWKEQFNTKDSHRFIFTNSIGAKLDNANIYRNLLTILKNENILNASPHTFRHTTASHLVIKGVSLYIVKDILRHASIRETELYSHLIKDPIKKALENLTISS